MGPKSTWDESVEPRGVIVHVVGSATDEVFSFLGPATAAIAHASVSQVVVMIDDPRFRRNLSKFHDSVSLVLGERRPNPYAQWSLLLQLFEEQLRAGPVRAVHLHGFVPYVVCCLAMRGQLQSADVFFSPHASRSIGTLPGIGRVLMKLAGVLFGRPKPVVIVNTLSEAMPFEAAPPPDVVESPVPDVFFEVPRNESRHPLVVSAGGDESVQNVERFAQYSVLLGGQERAIGFNWIGNLGAVSNARLTAANVAVFDEVSDERVASRLSGGWVYLAAGPVRGFPIGLVEAMAAGLPCVAPDCPQYAEIIRDGDTGFLCSTERQMIERVAMLLDDVNLRLRLGEAARKFASERFMAAQFEEKLLSAYAQRA